MADTSATSDVTFKTRVITYFETGSEPDVLFFFNGADANSFIEAGKVVSIDEIRKEYPDYAGNMNDDLITASLVDGKKYAVPVNGFWEAMFVNTEVLDAAGVSMPGANYTWERAAVITGAEPVKNWEACEGNVWKARIPNKMLMYGKEASNRKQEIDRQHHTIPNQRNQRPKDKHRGNVYNLLFRHGKVRSQNMEKLKCSFPTFCKQTFPQLHKIASYAHSHNADYGETPLTLSNKILKTLFCISFSAFEIFINLTNAKSTV